MSSEATRTVLVITGMRDNSCRERIADVLGQIKGVRDVAVSLFRARAVVEHEPTCEASELVRAVEGAGYSVKLDRTDRRV